MRHGRRRRRIAHQPMAVAVRERRAALRFGGAGGIGAGLSGGLPGTGAASRLALAGDAVGAGGGGGRCCG